MGGGNWGGGSFGLFGGWGGWGSRNGGFGLGCGGDCGLVGWGGRGAFLGGGGTAGGTGGTFVATSNSVSIGQTDRRGAVRLNLLLRDLRVSDLLFSFSNQILKGGGALEERTGLRRGGREQVVEGRVAEAALEVNEIGLPHADNGLV